MRLARRGGRVLAAASLLLLAGCSKPVVTRHEVAMDTTWEFTVTGLARDAAEVGIADAFAIVRDVEAHDSLFDPRSELSRFNAAGPRGLDAPSTGFLEVLRIAREASELSNGAFDITVAPLVRLWGFAGSPRTAPPSDAQVARARRRVGYKRVRLPLLRDRNSSGWAYGRPSLAWGTEADLGGIAKGFAVDQALAELRRRGVTSALVNAGGQVGAIGRRPDGGPWRIGIQHPRRPAALLGVLELTNASVSTSGDYQKYFEADGVRYHHILNPRTGRPARGLMSVTVVVFHPGAEGQGAWADALSTAFFVMGPDAALRLVSRLTGVECILVTDESPPRILVSSGLRHLALAW